MPSLKPILWFVLKLSVVYGLLLVPWPGIMPAYRAAFCAAGNLFLRTIGGDGRAYFRTIDAPTEGRDIDIRLENVRSRAGGTMEPPMNCRIVGYLPTCFTIALIAATPIPWRRRGPALLLGVLFIGMFVALTVWLRLVNVLSDPNVLRVFELGSGAKTAVVVLLKILAMSPVTSYIAPVLIWAVVALRREDFGRIAAHLGSPPAPSRIKVAAKP